MDHESTATASAVSVSSSSVSKVAAVTPLTTNTAMTELLSTRFGSRLLLQLETGNPADSDRVDMARRMLDTVEQQGLLAAEGWVNLIGVAGAGGSMLGTARALKGRLQSLQDVVSTDYDLLAQEFRIADKQAFNVARYLRRKYALSIGGVGGTIIYQVIKRMKTAPPGSLFMVLLYEGGQNYLNTIFNDNWMSEHDLIDPLVDVELNGMLAQLTEGV